MSEQLYGLSLCLAIVIFFVLLLLFFFFGLWPAAGGTIDTATWPWPTVYLLATGP